MPTRRGPLLTLFALLALVVLGAALGVLKGDSGGLRGQVGNLSAPWLLVAFLPALPCRSLGRGALTGAVATMAALAGFYAAVTVVLAGHLGGGGYLRELLVETEANRVYLVAGLVTGPAFGALGSWVGRAHRGATAYVVGGILAAEILVVALVQGHQLAPRPLYFSWSVSHWGPYVGECLVGMAVLVAAASRRLSRP
ncbi:MAG: hypothetical protein ACXVW4_09690 [Nocardioides sp.]